MDFENKYSLQSKIIKMNKDNNINFLIYGCGEWGKNHIFNLLFNETLIKNKKQIKYTYSKGKELIFTEYSTPEYIEINMREVIMNRGFLLKKYIKGLTTFNTFSRTNIVIHNINLLSKNEQFILRKIIERASNCKFILICDKIDTLIEPIISRCLPIKIDGINNDDFSIFLKKNKQFNNKMFKKMFKKNNNNLLYTFSEYKKYNKIKDIKNDFFKPKIKDKILKNIITYIYKKTNITNALFEKIDSDIYNLYTKYDMSYSDILLSLFNIIKEKEIMNREKINIYIDIALKYESRIKKANRGLFHLQAYIYNMKYILSL